MDNNKLLYPIPSSGMKGFYYSSIFGLFITFFLWFFKPFDINTQEYSFYELLIFGVISFGIFFIAHTVLPLMKSDIYRESSWSIYSQIIFYIILSFAIATLNGLFINFRNDLGFSWTNYLIILIQTFAVGIIPITLSVLISYVLKYKKIANQSNYINSKIDKLITTNDEQYNIKSNVKSEALVLNESSFLFAKSSGNYIEIFVVGEKPKILRMGLLDLEKQLDANKYMMRCHRSYLVNTSQINKVTGNAQGLQLWLKNNQSTVPVSRKYIEKIREVFSKK